MRIQRISSQKDIPATDTIDLNLLQPTIEKYRNKKGNMIPLLQSAQSIYGYIPKSVFIKISEETGLNLSDMYGVATFFAQFRLHPVGKHIINKAKNKALI